MNIDIVEVRKGFDMGFSRSTVMKAANVAGIQQGSLYYEQEWGADLDYFIQSEMKFQNESFKAYLTERMTLSGVDVYQALSITEKFVERNVFYVGETDNDSGELIR